MTHCIEPLIHDLIWCWLDEQDRYEIVSGEVPIGTGTNSGRIDIVGKTTDGEYHGYEIKDTDLSAKQLNRYIKSSFLDKVYHCSRAGPEINSIVAGKSTRWGVHSTLIDLKAELSNGIAAGQYTESEAINAVRETIGEQMWQGELRGFGQVNNRLLDDDEKVVKSFFTSDLGIPTVDFDSEETYIDLDTATKQLENEVSVPNEIGVIHVPVPISDPFNEPGDRDWFSLDLNSSKDGRAELNDPVSDIFTTSNIAQIKILRNATPLTRKLQPSLSRTDEAWIQHYVWRSYGTIREAVIPCFNNNSVRRVDVMQFKGADTATGAFQNSNNTEIIGVEAKGKKAVGSKTANVQVREQLRSYLESSCFTRLYLAVPTTARSEARAILNVSKTNPVSDVGLITVDQQGELTFVKDAEQRRQRVDGYIKKDGNKKYTRSVGYGRVKPREEITPESSCRIRLH